MCYTVITQISPSIHSYPSPIVNTVTPIHTPCSIPFYNPTFLNTHASQLITYSLPPPPIHSPSTHAINTQAVYAILLGSGLSRESLARLWGLANTATPGQLTVGELYRLLAAVAVEQSRGEQVECLERALAPFVHQPPVPYLGQPSANSATVSASPSSSSYASTHVTTRVGVTSSGSQRCDSRASANSANQQQRLPSQQHTANHRFQTPPSKHCPSNTSTHPTFIDIPQSTNTTTTATTTTINDNGRPRLNVMDSPPYQHRRHVIQASDPIGSRLSHHRLGGVVKPVQKDDEFADFQTAEVKGLLM